MNAVDRSRPGVGDRIRSVRLRTVLTFGSLVVGLLVMEIGCNFGDRRQEVRTVELDGNMTARDLVAHLNANTAKVRSWQSTDVEIRTGGPLGVPVGAKAMLAVEHPRNLRLVANSLRGNEADLGSNDERFWMWLRGMDGGPLMTVRHEHLPQVQQQLGMPVRPDWVMQALGVVPLDPETIRLDPDSVGMAHYVLISEESLPGQRSVKRLIEIDRMTGLVSRQKLVDDQGIPIAEAVLSDYQTDPTSGATLAHRVELLWPETKAKLTLTIGEMEINPAHIRGSLWDVPTIAGSPTMDLSSRLASRSRAGNVEIGDLEGGQAPRGHGSRPLPPLKRSIREPDFAFETGAEPPFMDEEPTGNRPVGHKEPQTVSNDTFDFMSVP